MTTHEPASLPCPALCQTGSGEETPIPCGDARATHGVCIRHGQMRTNGELRFRLNNSDGSAYIRTQTSGQSEGWQNPHYHKQLKETYIVEQGWIGYAELMDRMPAYRRYGPGDVFTTQPGIVHNVYMAANSVIHTVKHSGMAPGPEGTSDWWGNDDCKLLTALVGRTFPQDIRREERSAESKAPDPEKIYNAAYRHFDTLIWQVPAWSSALFAAIAASVNSFLTPPTFQTHNAASSPESLNVIAALFRMSTNSFAAIQIGLFGVFTLVLAYALYRFRWHQVGTKTWSRTSTSPPVSPQRLLQFVVNVEAAVLLFVAGALTRLPRGAVGVVVVLVSVYMLCLWEQKISAREQECNPPKRRKTDTREGADVRGAS